MYNVFIKNHKMYVEKIEHELKCHKNKNFQSDKTTIACIYVQSIFMEIHCLKSLKFNFRFSSDILELLAFLS